MHTFPIAAKRRRTLRASFRSAPYRQARVNKVKPTSYHPRSAAPGGTRSGGVAERLKAADCKSADVCLRRFESYPIHQGFGWWRNRVVAWGEEGARRSAGVAQW